jgi:hypothetical protein
MLNALGYVTTAADGYAPGTSSYSISCFNNLGYAVSSSTGYDSPYLNLPEGIAVDPSGNVWVANGLNGAAAYIGLATSTVTPLATGIRNGTLGTQP